MQVTFTLTTGTLDQFPDPSWAQIVEVLRDLPEVEEDDYLILARTDELSRGVSVSYLQTRPYRKPEFQGKFLIEFRDGVLGRHFYDYVESAELTALFESYFSADNQWRDMAQWQDISDCFEDLRAAAPPEKLPSPRESQDTKKSDTEFEQLWEKLQ